MQARGVQASVCSLSKVMGYKCVGLSGGSCLLLCERIVVNQCPLFVPQLDKAAPSLHLIRALLDLDKPLQDILAVDLSAAMLDILKQRFGVADPTLGNNTGRGVLTELVAPSS